MLPNASPKLHAAFHCSVAKPDCQEHFHNHIVCLLQFCRSELEDPSMA
jgi:hypothetical protein